MDGCQNYGPFLDPYYKYGTYNLGYPKKDHNFDNHPYNLYGFMRNIRGLEARTLKLTFKSWAEGLIGDRASSALGSGCIGLLQSCGRKCVQPKDCTKQANYCKHWPPTASWGWRSRQVFVLRPRVTCTVGVHI